GLRRHEGLAVVVSDAGEQEIRILLAPHRPGRIARQDVDLLVLEGAEALGGGERNVLDLPRIVEDRGGERAAEVDVEARPLALVVLDREAGDSLAHAADELATVLH